MDLTNVPKPADCCKTLTAFPLFNLLPAETRLQIWEEALPDPRTLFIEPAILEGGYCHCVRSDIPNSSAGNFAFFSKNSRDLKHDEFDNEGVTFGPSPLWAVISLTPIPGILLACYESCSVAAKHYTLAFGNVGSESLSTVWFDFRGDRLFMA